MPGLVPGIHVLAVLRQEARGWPGQAPAMTERAFLFRLPTPVKAHLPSPVKVTRTEADSASARLLRWVGVGVAYRVGFFARAAPRGICDRRHPCGLACAG